MAAMIVERGQRGEQQQFSIDQQHEIERRKQIAAILAADRKAFETWVQEPNHARNLAMPEAALRHVLLSDRMLEIAYEPGAVLVRILEQESDKLEALLLERRIAPITNVFSLVNYWERMHQWEQSPQQLMTDPPDIPPDVDVFHATHRSLVKSGEIGLNEYVTHDISFRVDNDEQLHIRTYQDRDELRHMGIATAFYRRLHEAADEMGFRFIKGRNNTQNAEFYTEWLGRSTLAQVKPELRTTFHPTLKEIDLNTYTIDFIRPADKAVYLM